ncbi:relaxin-3 receptor 1-like [Anguilla anguilla]|uniref:relaxin-3 receptor 1-like n=1 Tax=Anguilla anguilla TaxID=7936 RepID=UPI0015B08876|nr:relaxin-3 receptor 1-like [Anguilla anguilla]
MSAFDLLRLLPLNMTLRLCLDWPVCNRTAASLGNLSDALDLYVPGDGSPWLRAAVATVYFAVSAVGLAGNAAVLCLLRARGGAAAKGAVNFFVLNLAATDLLFSAAMALWAAEAALDYHWPFGGRACKAASFLTSLNLFGSVFFLAAMSVTRYCSVASALAPGGGAGAGLRGECMARLAAALIWAGSVLAAAPRAAFAEVVEVGGDRVCLLHFPNGTFWLGLHHLLRVVVGFLLPYAVILLSYLLLLRFLCNHGDPGRRRRARVSRSVAVVILAFCVCWLPNNILTFWGLLIHLDAVKWSSAFYLAHTYVFPLTSCLAQVNGCLNPVLYCLMHQEHRRALRGLLCGAKLSAGRRVALQLHSLGGRSGAKPFPGPPPSTSLTGDPSPKSSGLLNG